MPWCPNCKTEYRDGISVCADCGAALIQELNETAEKAELCYMKNEEAVMKLKDFLSYSGIEAETGFIPEENAYLILVAEEDLKKARTEYKAFLTVEGTATANAAVKKELSEKADRQSAQDIDLDNPDDISKLEKAGISPEEVQEEFRKQMKAAAYKPAGVYESQADKARDYSSTGYTFTVVGVALLIFTALNCFKVITLFAGNLKVIIPLFAFAIAGICVGISSFRRAKKASASSVQEEQFTEQFNKWLENHAYIMTEGRLDGSDGTSDELLYLERMDAMKQAIEACYGPLDEDFVDSKLDEFYEKHF